LKPVDRVRLQQHVQNLLSSIQYTIGLQIEVLKKKNGGTRFSEIKIRLPRPALRQSYPDVKNDVKNSKRLIKPIKSLPSPADRPSGITVRSIISNFVFALCFPACHLRIYDAYVVSVHFSHPLPCFEDPFTAPVIYFLYVGRTYCFCLSSHM
jgi:hypothetical protein